MTKRERLILNKRRNDPEFEKFFMKHASLDEATGKITVKDCYAHLGFNMAWQGKIISVTYANAVWFLKKGRWPKPGHHIDHVNDDPLDNSPDNLQEITAAENQAKRRGRKIYRSYGRGKYGYGLYIHADKRDGRFYVTRTLSRGHGEGDLKGIKISLGGYDTREEAELVVKDHAQRVKDRGLAYIPDPVDQRDKKATIKLNEKLQEMRDLRKQGCSVRAVAEKVGLNSGAVYNRIRDIQIDCRSARKKLS